MNAWMKEGMNQAGLFPIVALSSYKIEMEWNKGIIIIRKNCIHLGKGKLINQTLNMPAV